MPIKELLVVSCLIVTAMAMAFTGQQLYAMYISSIPGALTTGYHIDNNGIIHFSNPPSSADEHVDFNNNDVPLTSAQPIKIDGNMMRLRINQK